MFKLFVMFFAPIYFILVHIFCYIEKYFKKLKKKIYIFLGEGGNLKKIL
jgi:hypothetical protein